jgi:hypothetical protein
MHTITQMGLQVSTANEPRDKVKWVKVKLLHCTSAIHSDFKLSPVAIEGLVLSSPTRNESR